MTDIVVTRLTPKEFKTLDAGRWNRLAAMAPVPSVFCTHEWLCTWWEHFGDKYEFYFLVAWSGGSIAGALPLVKRSSKIEDSFITSRVLFFAGSEECGSDHIDLIVEPSKSKDIAKCIAKYLRNACRRWDLVYLPYATSDGNWRNLIGRHDCSFDYHAWKATVAPYLLVSGEFDDFKLKRFRGKKRRQLEAMYRKACEAGYSLHSCKIGQEKEVINALFSLHYARARQKNIRSAFLGEQLRQFHHDIAERFNQTGALRSFVLEGEGGIVGVLYGFQFAGSIYWYQLGIDPELSKLNLGTVLVYELVKNGFSDPDVIEINFLRGPGAHKSKWTRSSRDLAILAIYNTTILGQAQRVMFRIRRTVVSILKRNGHD